MKRNVSLDEISDGRLYSENDMVKADSRGCKGCYKCCTGMGESVILDPYDVHRLQFGIGMGVQQLLEKGCLELHVVDGCILPNLSMNGEGERCAFLNAGGRCSIHEARPGICRLFPLGRYYEDGDFKYFLQTGECEENNRLKVKASKWIDTPMVGSYHEFLCKWHYFLNGVEEEVRGEEDSEKAKLLNLLLLNIFYLAPYKDRDSFYEEFEQRMELFKVKSGS